MTTSGPEFGSPAALTPSDGPSTVQDDLDNLKPISTAAQLEARYPAVGGVHTIPEGMVVKLLPGETEINITPNTLHFVKPGGISSNGRTVTILSNVDATLVTGEPAVNDVEFANVSLGPSAKVWETTHSGFSPSIQGLSLVGMRPGSMTNIAGSIDGFRVIALAPGAEPFEFLGTVGPITVGPLACVAPGTLPWTSIRIPASSTVIALDLNNTILTSQDPGDRFIELNANMTVPPTSIIVFERPRVEGPGSMFGPGFDQKSAPVIVSSGINVKDSLWLGNVAFDGDGLNLIVTHDVTPGVGVVMPSENAGGLAVLTKAANQERFDLDIVSIQDWSIKGTGRSDNITAPVTWYVNAARSGGPASAREFIAWAEYTPDLGANWFLVPGSESCNPIDARQTAIQGGAVFTYDRAWEFRLVVASETSAATDSVSRYGLTVFK